MFLRIAFIILIACPSWMASSLAIAATDPPTGMSELNNKRPALFALIKDLNASKSRIATLQAERNAADESLSQAQTRSREARDNLEKKQKYDRENPGEITDKLNVAGEQNRQAASALKSAKENLANIERSLIAANVTGAAQFVEFKRLQQDFEGHLKALVDYQLQHKVEALQIAKVVEAKGVVSCGDDAVRICKDKSRKEAEKKATEQGSIIDFSAFTEVENFQLTKEEIRSEVHATLSSEEILSQKYSDEASSAVTEIRVKVDPVISPSLRKRMADAIRDDLLKQSGGPIYFSEVSDPSLDMAAMTAQRRKEALAAENSAETDLDKQAEDARYKSAQRGANDRERESSGKWKLNAGLNSNSYNANFINGAFNGKTAGASYMEFFAGLTAAISDGYFIELSAAQGSGKHSLYQPAPNQSFKRSTYGALLGSTLADFPNAKYYLSVRSSTSQLAALGQTWKQDTFATTGFGGGIELTLPVANGTFGFNIEGGMSSATWSDDSGFSSSSNSIFGGSSKVSYSYLFAQSAGVTASAGMQSYDFKFKSFSVKEAVTSIGVGVFAKF